MEKHLVTGKIVFRRGKARRLLSSPGSSPGPRNVLVMGFLDSITSKCVPMVRQVPKLSLTPLPLIGVPGTMENREDSNYRSIELVEDGIRKSSYDRPAIVFINRDTFSDSVQDRAYLLQSSPRILLLALAGDSHTIHKRVQDHLWLPPQSELQRARRFRT